MVFLLSDLLTQSALRYPEKEAVSYENDQLTYAELKKSADKIANVLLQTGLKQGDRVGIYAPKSVRTIVAILGVLQAGGVYVPLDPASPASRVAAICANCQIPFLLTRTSCISTLKVVSKEMHLFQWIGFLDDTSPIDDTSHLAANVQYWNDFSDSVKALARPPAVESDLAYILNTSGSTGIPKGVMLTHRNALSFVEWSIQTFSVSSQDRIANYAPLHFDLSIFDLFVSLACGATLVIVPQRIAAFPYELVKWIERERISIWYSVPSILKMMLRYGKIADAKLTRLRLILFAGEVFAVKYLRDLVETLPHVRFCNLYGPTETNVCTFYWVPNDPDILIQEIPIGKACAYCDTFAVREDGSFVREIGDEGELCVRGASVMCGYWGNEEQTQRALQTQPSFSGLIYHTGDMVRLRADGCWDFLGRRDHLVKSRGYRIELGEIEAALHSHSDIEQAIVIPVPDELIGNRLIACLVPMQGRELHIEDIRRYCTQILPDYMVPERVMIYNSLPLTGTGKADRILLSSQLLSHITENNGSKIRKNHDGH